MKPVLLVEDDPQSCEVIKDIFKYENVPGELICAESGEDALEILRTTVPALILMDMRLPGMDGMTAVRMIKANPATRCVPIWAVTGNCTSSDVDAALASGCSGYFVKPIDLRKVANDLRAIQSFSVASLAAPTAGVLA